MKPFKPMPPRDTMCRIHVTVGYLHLTYPHWALAAAVQASCPWRLPSLPVRQKKPEIACDAKFRSRVAPVHLYLDPWELVVVGS